MQSRYLEQPVLDDLSDKMVFLAGPRQVGKTTLAKAVLSRVDRSACFSWDRAEDRRAIRAAEWPGGDAMIVLDEIHKWKGWKRFVKGEFDRHRERLRILVTGSARLDVYRKGSDSLQGRYHHYRLHPFSVAEIGGSLSGRTEPGAELDIPSSGSQDEVDALMRFGGFPEPLLAANARVHRRWQKERLERFFREDVRDLELIRDLGALEQLAELVAARVGSPLSLNALREDLEVSHRAVTSWIAILERLYHVVRLQPHVAKAVRGLRKMAKAYLWDWSLVADEGARFENLVAMHLLKFCHVLADRDGYDVSLRYVRDRDGREVDFLVLAGKAPWFAVEAKLARSSPSPSIAYFRDRLRIPWCYQVTRDAGPDTIRGGVRTLPAAAFLRALA